MNRFLRWNSGSKTKFCFSNPETALSKKPDELIKYEIEELEKGTIKDVVVLKDPYLLDFLDIKDRFYEKVNLSQFE